MDIFSIMVIKGCSKDISWYHKISQTLKWIGTEHSTTKAQYMNEL